MATVTCLGCQERDERIAALERRVAELEATVHDLTARLGTNATNSGLPPSANPPGAPKPGIKQPTGKQPGGQPGHPVRLKRRLPPERLHQVIPFVPRPCARCHEALPAQPGPGDPAPTWHQVAELPAVAAQVTAYQGHYRTCPGCGTLNHAPISQETSRPPASAPGWRPRWVTWPAVTACANAAWKKSPRTSSPCRFPWAR
jgi:hypothetical protein